MLRIFALAALLSSLFGLQAMDGSSLNDVNSENQKPIQVRVLSDVDKAVNLYITIMQFLDTGDADLLVCVDKGLENGAKPYLQFPLNKDGVDITISVNEALLYLEQDLQRSFNHYDFDIFLMTTQEKPTHGAIFNKFIHQGDSLELAKKKAREVLFNRFLATGKIKREGLVRLTTIKTLLWEHERKLQAQSQAFLAYDEQRRNQTTPSGKGGRPSRHANNLTRALFFVGATASCYFLYQRFFKVDKNKRQNP